MMLIFQGNAKVIFQKITNEMFDALFSVCKSDLCSALKVWNHKE